MSDFIPDPVKSYKPKQPAGQQSTASTTATTFIPNLTDEQLRSLAREKLSEALQAIDPKTQPGMTKALCAEVKDRLDGKAPLAMTLDATLRNITVNATIRFADELPVIDHVPQITDHNIE